MHYLFLSGEEMPRGEFKTMLGLGERMATDALGALVKRGLLKSDSPQGKVRFGLPQHALRFLLPRLWPEAEADSAVSVRRWLGDFREVHDQGLPGRRHDRRSGSGHRNGC